MGKAIPYFEKAIEMDDEFGLPHARLGLCYVIQAFGGKISWELARKKMMIHIERTNQLGTETPEAYFALFTFYTFHQWDWAKAAEVTKKGLKLFPNNTSLYHALSTLYYISGDKTARVETHQKGLELDPLSVQMILFMGVAYVWSLEFENALPYFNKVLDMVPNNRVAFEYKGWIAAFLGKYEEAVAIFEKLEPATGYRLHRSTGLGWVYFKQGKKEKAEACLQELLKLEAEQSVGFSLDLATLYTCFNDFDNAFRYLEKAISNKVGDSMMCRSDPFLAPLKTDPRFAKMETLVGKAPL
jgi:tetratricopeptide (TPR) repeat protein